MSHDRVDLPLIRRNERLLEGGHLDEDERLVVGARVCGRGPNVLDPAVEVVAEGEPDGLDVVLDSSVKELLGTVFVLVEEPADEAVPDRERLVPPVREAAPNEVEVMSERLWGAEA